MRDLAGTDRRPSEVTAPSLTRAAKTAATAEEIARRVRFPGQTIRGEPMSYPQLSAFVILMKESHSYDNCFGMSFLDR